MNFKIENNFLNIANYPSIERHFEDMASKGWLVNKIIAGNLFIYKRIKPEELEFSISPYEVETAFTKKSKEELEEFQTVCETVGWNYCTKSYDLHIYFKEKDSEAVPIQTDEEEEFRTLEFIAKKQLKAQYFQVPLFILLAWMNIGGIFSSIYAMRDGLTQIISLLIPVAIILGVLNIIELRRFLKKNRKNMDLGKNIEFSNSRFYIYKICFSLFNIIIVGFLIYLLYVAIVLKNKIMLMGFVPGLLGVTIGTLYRIFVKPSKKSLSYKKVVFFVTILAGTMISIGLVVFNIGNITGHKDNSNIAGYKVLSVNDFTDKYIEDEGNLRKSVSIFIPKSYDFSSYTRGHGLIVTEYSNALSESLAKNLVNRYKKQAENRIIGRNSQRLKAVFESGDYYSALGWNGLNERDFNNLKDKNQKEARDMAMEIIINESIVEDKENLWNMDEVYFLTYDKMEIVIRNGKEVFYLEGKDFSDSKVIEIVKDRLKLN